MSYAPDHAVTYIVVHYSATPVEKDFMAKDIDEMHRARGFKEIGYHYFIRKDGTVETGRDLSQPGRFEIGAHSKGENSKSVGVCYEGGVRQSAPNIGYDSRTKAQTKAMIDLIKSLQSRFPNAVVRGHRDMPGAATQCPGFDAGAWWDGVTRERAGKVRSSPAKSTTIQATGATAVGIIGTVSTTLSKLDPTTQLVVVGAAAVMLILLGWIARERLRKWAEGDR